MKFTPTLEQARTYQGAYRYVPVSTEILSDFITPVEALRILKKASTHCYLFESAEDKQRWGRWSFLGYDPKLELTCRAGVLQCDGVVKGQVNHPGEEIQRVLDAYHAPQIEGLPPFTGGLVGYFSYDYIQYAEPSLHLTATGEEPFQDVDLMLFDKVIAFDHFRQKLVFIVHVALDTLQSGYQQAQQQLKALISLLRSGEKEPKHPLQLHSPFTPVFTKEHYCDMVRRAKEYIVAGDIFQVVLSNRIEAEMSGSLFEMYRVLRTLNPSPYMFYLSSGKMELAGASPETLIRLEDGVLHTFPLAGSRPRGKTPQEDAALAQELLADEKECAEHNMLVDLGRNDIGKISEIGSVQVEKYMEISRFSHIMHIGSTVRGTMRQGLHAIDAVDAILPAGTLSGAPKLRACQIIDELEGLPRGVYGGAVGYLDFTGNLDVCIGIRLAWARNGRVYVRSGAGIVADSVPETEHQECLHKAGAVLDALRIASEDLDG